MDEPRVRALVGTRKAVGVAQQWEWAENGRAANLL
jgi:hypothetical protein